MALSQPYPENKRIEVNSQGTTKLEDLLGS